MNVIVEATVGAPPLEPPSSFRLPLLTAAVGAIPPTVSLLLAPDVECNDISFLPQNSSGFVKVDFGTVQLFTEAGHFKRPPGYSYICC